MKALRPEGLNCLEGCFSKPKRAKREKNSTSGRGDGGAGEFVMHNRREMSAGESLSRPERSYNMPRRG